MELPDSGLGTDPRAWPLDASGPYRVGFRRVMRTYTPAGRTESRTISIGIWYPTLALSGPPPTYGSLFIDRKSFTNAPLAPSPYTSGKYPVHVHSHGRQGFDGTSAFLMRHFASHGWVAIAPSHTGDTLGQMDPLPTWLYYARSLDITQTLDLLEQLPAEDPLAGKTETARVFMSGHSLGTLTVWATSGATFDVAAIRADCFPAGCTESELAVFAAGVRDRRVIASSLLAGSIRPNWFGTMGWSSVTIPMLSMSGTLDLVGADTQFADVQGLEFDWAEVTGACHQFFALGGCEDIADERQVPVVGGYNLALARRDVLMDPTPAIADWIEGRTVPSEVRLMRKTP